jgi:hypothetical protein
MNILGWAVVGLIAGTLASWVTREERRDCLYTLVIGVDAEEARAAAADEPTTRIWCSGRWRGRSAMRLSRLGCSRRASIRPARSA